MPVFQQQARPWTGPPTYQVALAAYAADMSVVPIRADGSKQPALPGWKAYQQRRPTQNELQGWFQVPGLGLALVTGAVSGNLEALDFDDGAIYQAWRKRVQGSGRLATLFEDIASGYEEATPSGGRHVLYRCLQIAGNQKLASRPMEGNKRKSLIETRGEGGLIIVDPSRGSVHPSGKSYVLQRGGVGRIKTITPEQRLLLLAVARTFDEVPPLQPRPEPSRCVERGACGDCQGLRPGDLFNQRGSWEEMLLPHGWELVRFVGEEGQWRRPGKRGLGISATTNYGGSDLFYVFSTSTVFEPERGYSKFAAYTLLNHGGDFSAAARALAAQGYTEQERNTNAHPWLLLS